MSDTTIRVRGYHLDGYGHVNNARYLEFLEEARWAFFEHHGLMPYLKSDIMVVTRIDIRYRRPSTLGDKLRVETLVSHTESRQVLLTQNIILAATDKNAVEAEITLVPVSRESGRATDLASKLFQYLSQLAK